MKDYLENERNPMRSPKERILLMAPESMSALIIIVSLKEMSRHAFRCHQ